MYGASPNKSRLSIHGYGNAVISHSRTPVRARTLASFGPLPARSLFPNVFLRRRKPVRPDRLRRRRRKKLPQRRARKTGKPLTGKRSRTGKQGRRRKRRRKPRRPDRKRRRTRRKVPGGRRGKPVKPRQGKRSRPRKRRRRPKKPSGPGGELSTHFSSTLNAKCFEAKPSILLVEETT